MWTSPKTHTLSSPSVKHAFLMLEIDTDNAHHAKERRAAKNANTIAGRVERDCAVNTFIDFNI